MSPDSLAVLESELRRENLFTTPVYEKLSTYVSELQRWNRKLNLTSLQGEELVRRLVVDPVQIGRQLHMSGTLLDIGSGNGSPGIPLHVSLGLETVHLVESRSKRAAFLRHMASLIDPKKIWVHKTRVEDLDAELEKIDWFSLQAVAPAAGLLESLRRWGHARTRIVWMTNVDAAPVPSATRVIKADGKLGGWVFRLDQS